MAEKRLHIAPFLIAAISLGLFRQSTDPPSGHHDTIGFALLPGANSSAVSFYLVRKFDDPGVQMQAWAIEKTEFECIGSGMEKCTANPDGEDLFAKYDIADCGYHKDTIINHMILKGGLSCSPVDDVWKLRYSEWPYEVPAPFTQDSENVTQPQGPGAGWARFKNAPSEGQENMLKQYGINEYSDIISGDNVFHLLHDMQDPTWVARYAGS